MVPAQGRQTVLWLIAVLLAVIATALVSRWDGVSFSRMAQAQMVGTTGAPTVGARGIYAFTGQLGAKEYGLFMLDVDSGTLWCYQMARHPGGDLQLQLVAARSWIFDRYLEEFNVAKPTPSEVQIMVRQQRSNATLGTGVPASPNAAVNLPPTQPESPASETFVPALPQGGK